MDERDDLLSRLRSVDEVLAGARPRAHREAQLLAKLRAADRARQPAPAPSSSASPSSSPSSSSSSSSSPPPSLLLALQRGWRPLSVTAALCAAFALALHAGYQAKRPADASTSHRSESESDDEALDPEATQLSSTKSAPRSRAVAPWRRTSPIEEHRERALTPTPLAPKPSEAPAWTAPPPRAPWDSELPSPSPQLSSRDEAPLRDTWPPAGDARLSSAARAQGSLASSSADEPRVLWAEGGLELAEIASKSGGSSVQRGQALSPASGPRARGCELAESLVDKARADCEAQSLTLSDHGLAYLDACGEGRFRGLDYACARVPPRAPPSSKAPAGCFTEDLPLDDACTTEEELRLTARHSCEDAGLTLAGLTLDPGSCNDGFQEARVLCCEEAPEVPLGKDQPRIKRGCAEDDPDCTQ